MEKHFQPSEHQVEAEERLQDDGKAWILKIKNKISYDTIFRRKRVLK